MTTLIIYVLASIHPLGSVVEGEKSREVCSHSMSSHYREQLTITIGRKKTCSSISCETYRPYLVKILHLVGVQDQIFLFLHNPIRAKLYYSCISSRVIPTRVEQNKLVRQDRKGQIMIGCYIQGIGIRMESAMEAWSEAQRWKHQH